MTDLRIELFGITFKNPIFLSAADHTHSVEQIKKGIDAGAAAVIPKTITNYVGMQDSETVTNYRVINSDFKNADGKIERGYSFISRGGPMKSPQSGWLEKLGELQKYARERDAHIIGSIWGDIDWMVETAKKMEEIGLSAIEIDAGCPHLDGRRYVDGFTEFAEEEQRIRGLETIVKAVNIPVIYKVPVGLVSDMSALILSLKDMGFAAATMTNRHLGFMPDIETGRPFMDTYFGIGGSWMLPLTLYNVFAARLVDRDFVLIGSNGAANGEDAIRFLYTGASAVQLCTTVMINGYGIVKRIISDLEKHMNAQGFKNVREMVGMAADQAYTLQDLKDHKRYANVDRTKCVGCGKCADRCPWNAIQIIDRKAVVKRKEPIDYRDYSLSGCVGCGLCTSLCPTSALNLQDL